MKGNNYMKNTKWFKTLAALLCIAAMLTACGGQTPDVTPDPAPEETEPEVTVVAVDPALEGDYHEQIAGRGMLSLQCTSDGGADISVHWSSSASESSEWSIHVTYDEEKNALVYTDAVKTDFVYESEDKSTETEDYSDGTGYFEIGDDTLTWHDDKQGEGAEPSVFVKNGSEPSVLPNPWTDTSDIEEAESVSGVSFDPPIEEALPWEDHAVSFVTYSAMPGTISALYESEMNKLVVRKSNDTEGLELSGDFNTYSKEWDISLKGLAVHCYGDGETINLATFGYSGAYFSVSFNAGEEGKGLTANEVNSLVMGMQ